MPKIGELIFLVILLSVVIGFFVGFRKITILLIGAAMFIVMCIISGFFMAIGFDIYRAMIM